MTDSVPKALLEVAGRPFADHQLTLLARQGFRSVVYCIGHRGSQIRDFVGDGSAWGLSVRYSDEGSDLRGTGGALRCASERDLLDPEFCVVYGDSYLPVDPRPMWSTFATAAEPVLMAVWRNEGRFAPSNVSYEPGRPLRYRKHAPTPDMRHIDYGRTMFRRQVVERIDPRQVVDLADLVESLSAEDQVGGFEVHERFYEVGSPAGLADVERYLGRLHTDHPRSAE